ncbi:MAG: hypothetical protein KGL39_18850 [Patescibacteria group bacterium]|nr:hypothetical protein [Patescibacteria group bacterium]
MTETKSTEAAKFFEWADNLEIAAKLREGFFLGGGNPVWNISVFDDKTQKELIEAFDRLIAEKLPTLDEHGQARLAEFLERVRVRTAREEIGKMLMADKIDDALIAISEERNGGLVGLVCDWITSTDNKKNGGFVSSKLPIEARMMYRESFVVDIDATRKAFDRIPTGVLKGLTSPLSMPRASWSLNTQLLGPFRPQNCGPVIEFFKLCHEYGVRFDDENSGDRTIFTDHGKYIIKRFIDFNDEGDVFDKILAVTGQDLRPATPPKCFGVVGDSAGYDFIVGDQNIAIGTQIPGVQAETFAVATTELDALD